MGVSSARAGGVGGSEGACGIARVAGAPAEVLESSPAPPTSSCVHVGGSYYYPYFLLVFRVITVIRARVLLRAPRARMLFLEHPLKLFLLFPVKLGLLKRSGAILGLIHAPQNTGAKHTRPHPHLPIGHS